MAARFFVVMSRQALCQGQRKNNADCGNSGSTGIAGRKSRWNLLWYHTIFREKSQVIFLFYDCNLGAPVRVRGEHRAGGKAIDIGGTPLQLGAALGLRPDLPKL